MRAAMRLLDVKMKDGQVDYLEWCSMMDWTLVATNVFERREYYSSLYKRSQAEHREWIAKIHAEYDDAVPRQQALIDHGRYWGMHEDWRKTARNRGGPPSWRLLHEKLHHLATRRAQRLEAHEATKANLLREKTNERARQAALRKTGNVWDTPAHRHHQENLELATKAVHVEEERAIRLMEENALHLVLHEALQDLLTRGPHPPAKLLRVNREAENVREVLESFLVALVGLSEHQRTVLLMSTRLPQFQ